MEKISFCIASAKNEKNYTLGVLKSLKDNTNFLNHEVLIFIDSDNQNTYEELLKQKEENPNIKIYRNTSEFPVGSQRNVSIMFYHASNDVVIYLQSDMVVCPNFDKYFLEALNKDKNRIISAARIEPPLHPPSPEKIVKDFGLSPEKFKYDEFYKFTKNLNYFRNGMGWSDATAGTDAVGYTIEFVAPDSSFPKEQTIPANPAVWETEPKDQVSDLDIYYEMSGLLPISLDSSNFDTIIPVGSTIQLENSDILSPMTTITSIDGDTGDITISNPVLIEIPENVGLNTTYAPDPETPGP